MDIINILIEIETDISKSLDMLEQDSIQEPFLSLENCINKINKSFSGSWIGYHANTYYENFTIPPKNVFFSKEWGLNSTFIGGTVGNWNIYQPDFVKEYILDCANIKSIDKLIEDIEFIGLNIKQNKTKLISVLAAFLKNNNDDYIGEQLSKTKKINFMTYTDIINFWSPKGTILTRDMSALSQGIKTPPHLDIYAQISILTSYIDSAKELISNIKSCIFYIKNQLDGFVMCSKGTKIFIGHGHSLIWRELKDFISERLNLQWDEFNRVPVAGITNILRLSQLLNDSCFAFLILTAEDEQTDGSYHARMNVIHEVGLFQGRLGFEKAIVLLEDGCKEFTNIEGLGQIRFPKGNIASIFEDIRRVLEREKII